MRVSTYAEVGCALTNGLYIATDEDCRDVIEDVQYELDQLRTAVRLSGGERPEDESSLFVEAGLVHARNLIEFLCSESTLEQRPSVSQSARAVWFRKEREWKVYARQRQFEEQAGLKVKDINRRLNRRVFHIALDRAQAGRLDLGRIAGAIDVLWSAFLHDLDLQWRGQLR